VGLEMIVSLAVGTWVALVLLVVSMCRAAKWSDAVTDTALAQAVVASRSGEIRRSPTGGQPLRTLVLYDAAALLGVSPQTLLDWEDRYGFPKSSPFEHRYSEAEVLALRDSLWEGASIPAAVARASERTRRRRPSAGGAAVGHRRDGGLAS
jgi:lysylphosphatidylglycerol synthetase-like protein (DUF2156 family)